MVKSAGIDRTLMIVTLALIVIGMLMIYSSTMIIAKEKHEDSFFFLKRQGLWLILSVAAAAVIIFMKEPLYLNPRYLMPALGLVIVSLCAVFFFAKLNNTNRWLHFAGFSLQPSELAKIAAVIYLAVMLTRKEVDINQPKTLLFLLLPVGVIEVLILKEPDFGNFFLILLMTLILLFIAGLKLRYFALFLLLLVPSIYVLVKIDPLRLNRVTSFLNPDAHAATYSFQALQSVYAVGAGGVFGRGIGNSTQKLFFLPYSYTDFIFAIIGEELGLIGTFFVLMLYTLFLFRGIQISRHSDNPTVYTLVIGLTLLIILQALINISVTIGIFPTKGIPLPFISAGGTSLFASMITTAIILNISRLRKGVFLND
jgi:cell division protein FtsW